MRVAFVMHVMQVAGAEVLVAEMIRQLGDRIVPTILCLDGVGALGHELRDEGVEVVELNRRPGLDLSVASRMARAARDRSIDLIHAHQYTPFFYAALARSLPGVRARLVLTEHGRHYPDIVSRKRRFVNRVFLSRRAHAINACSEFSRRALVELDGFPAERVAVIVNGIDFEKYRRAPSVESERRGLGLEPGRRLIATVGRLHPIKGHDVLLEAFGRIAGSIADTDLLVVGEGPLRSVLERQVSELGLEERVRFLGVRSDVPRILSAVDLFCLNSMSESASLTVLEAMASELPIVATEVGGNPEMVRHGVDGLLVPRGDAQATAEAIGKILGDAALARQMGAAARRRVAEIYRLEGTVEAHYAVYRMLCTEGLPDDKL